MPGRIARAMLGGAAVLVLGCGTAGAQSYIRADCAPLIAQPGPDGASLTGRWYRRFWTGDCGGLSGCMAGSPNWNEVVGKLVGRSTAGERATVLAKACRLGPLIGLEWTRPKAVRKIDTGDLRRFNATLKSAGDIRAGLDRVEAEARAKISGSR